MNLQILKDANGNNSGVFIPMSDWDTLVLKHEDLNDFLIQKTEKNLKPNNLKKSPADYLIPNSASENSVEKNYGTYSDIIIPKKNLNNKSSDYLGTLSKEEASSISKHIHETKKDWEKQSNKMQKLFLKKSN